MDQIQTMNKAAILIGILFVASAVAYIYSGYWRHPEGFAKQDQLQKEEETKDKVKSQTKVIMDTIENPPFAMDPIRSVDDYEYNLVFKNEGDRAMTKATRDYLMSQYPKDWTVQPPSSELFQQGLAKYKEAFANPPSQPSNMNPYDQIDGSKMTPPDTLAAERKEREILATYVPKDPQSLTTYDAEDARELIRRIYDAKGLVAEVQEAAPNRFVIVSTRKKDEKILYEDELPQPAVASSDAQPGQGEGTITVPPVATEAAAGLDPFFTPSAKARDGRWDYTSWTPGLERMFAPNAPLTNWF